MAKKHYVAHKVGDRYELTPSAPEDKVICAGWLIGGGLLALFGLSRRSLPGALMTAVGGTMLYRGMTGHDPLQFIRETIVNWERPSSPSETPSYKGDFEGRATQRPRDEVEEASMESFPASDPPASTRASLPKG